MKAEKKINKKKFDIFGKGASFMGTMIMGISTQLFHTSKAGVLAIAGMILVGFLLFCLQTRSVENRESKSHTEESLTEYRAERAE